MNERGTTLAEKRRSRSRDDNALVRAVGRLPAKVHTKLLIAFVGTAVLLVAVGYLGQRVLGQSNDRVGSLGALQQRAFAYGQLVSDTAHVRALLAENVNTVFYRVWAIESPRPGGAGRIAMDQAAANAVDRIAPATAVDRLGFTPSAEDERTLGVIRSKADQLSTLMTEIIELEASGTSAVALREQAEQLATDLRTRAAVLADRTIAKIDDLIARNASSYQSSRDLFIGVAVGAIVLALLLGFVLSWSLIGPLQRIDSRLAAIASGDFSGHVEVVNRDELGALGANVNRMNDQLRGLYTELEEASRHKSEFLASMSHELRTPLNAILGFSQVLREKMVGDVNEKQAEYLDDIISSGNHLLSLINDVLDLSKVEAGQVELEITPFLLRETLERGVSMVKERAIQNGVGLTLEADARAGLVEADERRISQVVFNLLSNAVKFTPKGGSVVVSSMPVNGEMRVSVSDTGPGIAAEDQVRIFEEFQQTDIGARQLEGTGLGLALSKRLIELHGGRIWVESEPGKGSMFTFALPVGKH